MSTTMLGMGTVIDILQEEGLTGKNQCNCRWCLCFSRICPQNKGGWLCKKRCGSTCVDGSLGEKQLPQPVTRRGDRLELENLRESLESFYEDVTPDKETRSTNIYPSSCMFC